MEERRGPWYLITGLILGAAVGLLYAWVISPVRYVETAPYSLQAGFKDNYRSVIAAAYAADGDVGRARARLILLRDADPAQALAAQAQKILAEGGSQSDARQLALLAAVLVQPTATPASTLTSIPTVSVTQTKVPATTSSPVLPSATKTLLPSSTLTLTPGLTELSFAYSPTSTVTLTSQPSPGRTMTPTKRTGTPPATLTPTPTQGAPFALIERSRVCDLTSPVPMLQVQLNDASGHPVPGVEIQISWQGGQGSFFTGFMPEINPGYAVFQLTPGLVYSVHLTDGGQPVNDLAAIACSNSSGGTTWGGWYLLFQQP